MSIIASTLLLLIYAFTGDERLILKVFFPGGIIWIPPFVMLFWSMFKGYLRIEGDKLTRHDLIPKSIQLNSDSRVEKFANEFIIYSADKKLTINADHFTPETEELFLGELEKRGIKVVNLNAQMT